MRKAKRDAAAATVQKYLKGYLTHKHCHKRLAQTKIELTSEYFLNIRLAMQETAQVCLAYNFRKYLK